MSDWLYRLVNTDLRVHFLNKESFTIDTAQFVAHVPAVILVVTLAAPVDASPIATFKLIGTASGPSCEERVG